MNDSFLYGTGYNMQVHNGHVEMDEEEYMELVEEYVGICLACGETQDNVEPDAHEYTCTSCGEKKVYGIEELLVTGLLTFTGE